MPMSLIDYLKIDRQVAGEHEQAMYSFANIKAFTFGEKYHAHLYVGGYFEFHELQDALDVIAAEFSFNPGHVPLIGIHTLQEVRDSMFGKQYRKPRATTVAGPEQAKPQPLGNAKDRVLSVVPAMTSSAYGAPPIHHFIDRIRSAVVSFNLAGGWDTFVKGNL